MLPGNKLMSAGFDVLPSEDRNDTTHELVMFEHEGNLIFEHEMLGAEREICFDGAYWPNEITKKSYQGRTRFSKQGQTLNDLAQLVPRQHHWDSLG